MTAFARAKLQAVDNGTFTMPMRTATIIRLAKARQNSVRWWIPFGLFALMAGLIAGASWGHHNWRLALPRISLSLPKPDFDFSFDFSLSGPDPEAVEPYAETINPPPSDVVIPVPIVSELPPSAGKEASANSIDLSAGIALPASSLQVPDPDMPPAPQAAPTDAVTVVAAAIADAPAVLKEEPKPRNDPPPRIEVRNVSAPIIGNLIDEAEAKLEAGDAEGAIADYNRVLVHDRNNHPALTGLAFAAQKAGDYAAAIKANRGLLELDPDNDVARVNLVAALGAWDALPALKELQHMVSSRPDFAPAQMALAEALARQGHSLAALPHAKRAVELDPDNISYVLGLAATYDKLGHSDEAIEHYEQVLKASDAVDGDEGTPALPVSRAAILQRVSYLEKLMASAQNLAAQQ